MGDDAAVLLVSPRRREANFARRNDGKPSSNIFSTSFWSRTYFSASLVYDYIKNVIFYVRNQALVPPSSFLLRLCSLDFKKALQTAIFRLSSGRKKKKKKKKKK